MSYPHGETVVRLRRAEEYDEYSATVMIGNWDEPDELVLEGAFVASSSTSARRDAARAELLEEKSLYLDDPHADVQAQDRIRAGGVIYLIDGMPSADTNPWTGWQPIREIPLRRDTG
ncbi:MULTISPECIES: hypothetical protein [unclassified Leucobacter]|uniref:hypothetical protein n=1 Tax=unclassified Leucobacter TaxID=2621730 RepID=UPI0030193D0D